VVGNEPSKPGVAKKSPWTAKRILILVLLVVAVVLIVANFDSVQVNLLVATIKMPLALMLALMFALGWAAAALTARLRSSGGRG
jgi:lipopolysaccharide assembly protein A